MPFESSGCDVIDSTFNTTKPTRRIELQLSIHPDLVSFIAIESAAIKWKKGTKKNKTKEERHQGLRTKNAASWLAMTIHHIWIWRRSILNRPEPMRIGTDPVSLSSSFFFLFFVSALLFAAFHFRFLLFFFASSHLVSSPFPSSLSVFFTDSYLVTELTAVHFLWLILFFFWLFLFSTFLVVGSFRSSLLDKESIESSIWRVRDVTRPSN